jgi:alpha-D-ribose 1-methylphosphonate 5-triphosphate synthase subunit PhnH
MSENMLLPGFTDPVAGAQSCFRAVLDAMARPGRISDAGLNLTPPAPLAPATAAVLLTLFDYDTPVWLDEAAAAACTWIGFHCGAPLVSAIGECSFAVALAFPDLATLPAGSHEAPESAATLILQVAAFGHGRTYRLTGPGLREPALLSVEGLPTGFASAWQQNHARFPLGVDVVLCTGTSLAALPRSVALQEV